MNGKMRKIIAGMVIVAMVLTAPVAFGIAGLDLGGASVAQAAAKKGFVKKSGKWYYYKGGKKVKGLKKISGKYYFFNKKGVMQSGQKKVKGATYYFNKIKSGKKKGQAPALANKSKKMSGKIYYFQKNGKRYNFGYKSTGNQKGNDAVGVILSKAKVTSADKAGLQKAYNGIISYTGSTWYGAVAVSGIDVSKGTWKYQAAAKFIEYKKGICYNYAAITALTAQALGFKPVLVTGPWTFNNNGKHAWVVINEGNDAYIVDTLQGRKNKGKKAAYFYQKIGEKGVKEFTFQGYTYTQEKTF